MVDAYSDQGLVKANLQGAKASCDFNSEFYCFDTYGDTSISIFTDFDFSIFDVYVILVGFYFGAGILGILYQKLRAAQKSRITVLQTASNHAFIQSLKNVARRFSSQQSIKPAVARTASDRTKQLKVDHLVSLLDPYRARRNWRKARNVCKIMAKLNAQGALTLELTGEVAAATGSRLISIPEQREAEPYLACAD